MTYNSEKLYLNIISTKKMKAINWQVNKVQSRFKILVQHLLCHVSFPGLLSHLNKGYKLLETSLTTRWHHVL